MELTHRFTVPTPVEETWDHFNDIAGLAECFPGATVTSVEGDAFKGSAKVKLGPIALVYNGSGEFTEKDETARRMVVEAKGKDKRGNGTAGATVTLSMAEADGASTDVEVLTDLSITGKPAQFGRGVMQDVSDKLLGQFVTCLEERLGAPEEEAAAAEEPAARAPEAEPPSGGDRPAPPPPGAAPAVPPPPSPAAPTPPPRGGTSGSDDVLDLGTTVLPVLARAYWKQALAVVLGLVVLRWILRRR
jgi:carbon monoxide dehydrogenase subunit G